jgi:F0F1-type ATP synthase assembly protein I
MIDWNVFQFMVVLVAPILAGVTIAFLVDVYNTKYNPLSPIGCIAYAFSVGFAIVWLVSCIATLPRL